MTYRSVVAHLHYLLSFFFVDTFPKMPSHPQEESHVYLAEGSSASLELSEVETTSDQLVLVAGWNEESSQNGLWF